MQRAMAQCLRVRLLLRLVAQAGDVRRPVSEPHLAQSEAHRERPAALAAAEPFDRAVAPDVQFEQVANRQRVAGSRRELEVDHEPERLPGDLVLVVAEELHGGAVERLDHSVGRERDDPVRHVLEHRSRAHLAVAELLVERRGIDHRLLERARLAIEVDEDRHLRAQDARLDGSDHEVGGSPCVGEGNRRLVRCRRRDEDDRRVLLDRSACGCAARSRSRSSRPSGRSSGSPRTAAAPARAARLRPRSPPRSWGRACRGRRPSPPAVSSGRRPRGPRASIVNVALIRASGSRRASGRGRRSTGVLGPTVRAGVRASNDSHASTGFPG